MRAVSWMPECLNSARQFISRSYTLMVVALYFALSIYRIEYPGVFYDEILWGNAALGGIDDSMIILKLFDIPIMLMSYIGALKAWIYYPIFKITGVSTYSIRIPMILCGCVSLFLVKWVTGRLFNQKIAAIVTVMLAIDSSFVTQTRVDQGPVVLGLLISLGCIYYFVRLVTEFRVTFILAIFGLSLAGIFNKLNFIWFVNSLFISALLVYRDDLRTGIRFRYPHRTSLVYLLILMSYLVCALYFLVLNKIFGLSGTIELAKLPERVFFVFTELFIHQLNGDSFFNYALGTLQLDISRYYSFLLLIVLASGLLIACFKRKEIDASLNKSLLFIALITMLLFTQIVITDKAVSYWHVYTLFPFITMLFGYSIFCLTDLLDLSKMYRNVTLSLIMTTIIGYQVYMNSLYLNFYGKPEKNIYWSSAIKDLMAYTMSKPYTFVSADWGIHNQLITFSAKADKYIETCYWLDRFNSFENKYDFAAGLLNNKLLQLIQNTNNRPLKTYDLLTRKGFEYQKNWFSSQALNPQNTYAFILHSNSSTAFKAARVNLFQQASIKGIILKLEKTIADTNGRIIYEIYRPTASPLPKI